MALQFTHSFNGLTVKNCYAKVAFFSGSKHSLAFQVEHRTSANQDPYATTSHSCELLLEGPNPIKQAYEYLKTLPEFADAVDC